MSGAPQCYGPAQKVDARALNLAEMDALELCHMVHLTQRHFENMFGRHGSAGAIFTTETDQQLVNFALQNLSERATTLMTALSAMVDGREAENG